MMRAKTLAEANRRAHESEGITTYLHDFWGPRTGNDDGPHILLVDHPELNGAIKPHFHIVDQFQVFTEGTGYVGRHAVRPGSIHYTDEFTAYGPILNHDTSIRYMVIRPEADPGAKYMPGSRQLMTKPAGRTRYYQADMTPLSSGVSVRELSSEDDGLSVCEIKVAPGEAVSRTPGGTGAFGACYVVLDGEIVVNGHAYPKESCVYVEREETLDAHAGARGAILVFMRFSEREKAVT